MAIRITTFGAALLASAVVSTSACAASADAGKTVFKQQCALCHTAEPGDNGGAQGPDLTGVFGRKAGSLASFSYTPAMKNSGLTWDAATLNRFLAAPTQVVPGSSMVVAVPGRAEREDLIAYLRSVRSALPAGGSAATKGSADWKNDRPGRVYRIEVGTLPAPFDTPSARNRPKLVDRPKGAQPL